jgi:hypothetical protein
MRIGESSLFSRARSWLTAEPASLILPRYPGDPLAALVARARQMAASPEESVAFARAGRHPSSNPAITGTSGGAAKAELFVGDLLHGAGLAAPTIATTGWDGAPGRHYAYAERWPRQPQLFDPITRLEDVRPGDLLVVDWRTRRGASGGHIELITGSEGGKGMITTVGARTAGLVEDTTYGRLLAAAQPEGDHFTFDGPGTRRDADLFVLRPRLRG